MSIAPKHSPLNQLLAVKLRYSDEREEFMVVEELEGPQGKQSTSVGLPQSIGYRAHTVASYWRTGASKNIPVNVGNIDA